MQYQVITSSCYSHFLTLLCRCFCFGITYLCFYSLLYPHKTQWLCGRNFCVLWDNFFLLRDLAILYINYRLQRLYWQGGLLIIRMRFTGRLFFVSQGFTLCQIRREMTMHAWNVRIKYQGEQNAVLLPWHCDPRYNFTNTKKGMNLQEKLFYPHLYKNIF
jgi:hypothetical protein